jgi:hypothetical protein
MVGEKTGIKQKHLTLFKRVCKYFSEHQNRKKTRPFGTFQVNLMEDSEAFLHSCSVSGFFLHRYCQFALQGF